ncbi:hypothetical protein BH11ARM1_BH11ARM1_14510 [soil metagenome]
MAIADHPQGPFKDAIGKPLVVEYHHGAEPIDAHIFQDDDGTPYLYWGGWKHCVVAKLADDLLSLVEEPVEVTPKDYVEGPFMLKRDGTYYLMWSQGGWTNETYCVAYGRSDNPYGPFENEGIILRNQPGMVGAGHHSVLEHDGRYHMAYHRRAVESKSPHERFTCIDEMHFRPDGSIETVIQS